MPFPMAHPASVLPLWRYCSRWLNLPALVIGSLTPDIGYCFGRLQLDAFSHRPLVGALGFCLPMGSVMLMLFHWLRRPIVGLLPLRHQNALQPLCQRKSIAPFVLLASLLIGAWTHIGLDFVCHDTLSMAESFPLVRDSVFAAGGHAVLGDVLSAVITFLGVSYVALSFLNWLEMAVRNGGWVFPGFKWVLTLAVSAMALLLSLASHDGRFQLGIGTLALLSGLLVLGFLVAADGGLTEAFEKQPKQFPDGPEIERT